MSNTAVKRNYKDTLFRMVFREKKELLSLYNAINGTHYEDPEALTTTTIENALYMGLKNDVSFIIEDVMNLYEGQSSWNPNMPLRGLFYISSLYQGYLKKNHLDLYSSVQLKLPLPQYIVFYNGSREEPDRQVLRLSDSFTKRGKESCLECTAIVLNINYGRNQELLNTCKKLHDYSCFVSKVREYLKEGLVLSEAVDRAALYCIKHNILKELLEIHRTEVKQVILEEYDEELHMKTLYEEGLAAGLAEGKAAGLAEGKAAGVLAFRQTLLHFISPKWQLPEKLVQKIQKENSLETLQNWLTMALESKSVEELSEKIFKSVD